MNTLPLEKGQLCKVETVQNRVAKLGEVVEFSHFEPKLNGYVFKNSKGIKLVLYEDTNFSVLKSKKDIEDLIDLSLFLKDKKWFNELVEKHKFTLIQN